VKRWFERRLTQTLYKHLSATKEFFPRQPVS